MSKKLVIGNLVAEVPVIQGGMGVGVSLSSLAGAVAKHGGIGMLSTAQIGYREEGFDKTPIECNLRAIPKELAKAREIAEGGIIGANVMVATRDYDRYIKALVDAGIDLIVSGAGLPMDLPALTQGSSVKIGPIVSGKKALSVIVKYWTKKYDYLPDVVVVEGPKAGGHLGFSKEELMHYEEHGYEEYDEVIREVLQYAKEIEEETGKLLPVVIAGGIYEKSDMDHYLAMGANGVQMGTRFVTTAECDASPQYKQAYLNSKKEDIKIVDSPVGMPGRAIVTDFFEQAKKGVYHDGCRQCIKGCKPDQIPYCITGALIRAVKGNVQNGLVFCGSNAYRCQKIENVKDIMEEFREDL